MLYAFNSLLLLVVYKVVARRRRKRRRMKRSEVMIRKLKKKSIALLLFFSLLLPNVTEWLREGRGIGRYTRDREMGNESGLFYSIYFCLLMP